MTTPHLQPTGGYGIYTHYTRTGDYLIIHRDVAACDVAVITCLENIFDSNRTGGKLYLYPSRTKELMSKIRAARDKDALPISLEAGQTIVFYGGIVPHALTPVDENQQRIVSVLCYEAF